MKVVRGLLFLAGLVLIGLAVVYPMRDVTTADGRSCGTAWSAARKELRGQTGFQGDTTRLRSNVCKQPGRDALKVAGAFGAGGVLVLVLVAAWPSKKWRAPEIPPQYV